MFARFAILFAFMYSKNNKKYERKFNLITKMNISTFVNENKPSSLNYVFEASVERFTF